jgi:hypothetical protein
VRSSSTTRTRLLTALALGAGLVAGALLSAAVDLRAHLPSGMWRASEALVQWLIARAR